MENKYYTSIREAKNFIKESIAIKPEIGLILGSGLGALGDEVENKVALNYSDIPNFPVATVKGHKGRMIFGKLEESSIAVMQGRFHYYEGYTMKDIAFPILVMSVLGIKKIIITNASGGINTGFNPGDLMIIKDHINFISDNPLIGKNIDSFGPRFPDMSYAYSKTLIDMTKKLCNKHGIDIKEGVYIAMTGPAYETPAEIRMARILGADAVGMSTVPEVITASYAGMKVLGISCITNMAAGVLNKPLDHAEVVKTAETVKNTFTKLIRLIVKEVHLNESL